MLSGKTNEGIGKQHRQYPIIGTKPQEYIPWGVLAPHEKQVLRNHGQTLELLAKRGGLDWLEVVSILEDKTWRETPKMPPDEAKKIVLEHVAAWEAEQSERTEKK